MSLGSILKTAIGRGLPNDQDDVLKLKDMFADSGRLVKPRDGFSPFFDRPLEESIIGFQAENNLLTDGFLRPGGETERNLSRAFVSTALTPIFDLDIGGGVGNGAANDPQDLRNVSTALGALDHLKFDRTANPPSFMTAELEDGIRAFQRDKNLLEDGQITPDGETIGALKDGIQGGLRTLPARNDISARPEHAVVRHKPGKGPEPHEPTKLSAEENEALAAAPETESSTPQKGPNNSEFIVDNPDKTKINWKQLPLPKVRGKLEWKVKDGIRVKLGTMATGLDSLDYTVDWFPLDKSGRPMTIVKNPGLDGAPASFVGVAGITFRRGRTTHIYRPPYKRNDGWQVRVRIPPQHPTNGNSDGKYLNISYPDGTLFK